MFIYVALIVVIALAITAMLFALKKQAHKTIYKLKCICLSAGAFASLMLLITVIVTMCASGGDKARIIPAIKGFPSNFAHLSIWAIAVLGVLMLISNISLMKHEGMRPRNMIGTFLGVILAAATVVIYLISRLFDYLEPQVGSAVLSYLMRTLPLIFYSVLDYLECMMFAVIFMGYIAAKQKPHYDKDFIVILGCSINKQGGLLPLIKGRTNRAIKYAWDQEIACGKKVLYVPSGGKGSDEIISEASAMELYLLSHGAENDEVYPEKESKNTYENFAFSKKIIDKINPDAKVAFATTNYHVLRSGMLADRVGIKAEGIGSRTKWYFWPNGFAREVVAIFAMTLRTHIVTTAFIALVCAIVALF